MTTEPEACVDLEPSLAHLLIGLGRIEGRVTRAVERRRVRDGDALDQFKGLYISESDVDRLLDDDRRGILAEADRVVPSDPGLERWTERHDDAGDDLRLLRLARLFELTPLDVELLLIAVAPDVDARFERLYGYLQDDITQRRASAGLAIELVGYPTWSAQARSRLTPGAPLRTGQLVKLDGDERPFLTRALRVPDRIIAFLLGSDAPDAQIAPLLTQSVGVDLPAAQELADAIDRGAKLVYLVDRVGAASRSVVTEAFSLLGQPLLALDLTQSRNGTTLAEVPSLVVREVRLRGGGSSAGPVEVLSDEPEAIRTLADGPRPTVVIGSVAWEPTWSSRAPFILDAPVPTAAERRGIWRGVLDASDEACDPSLPDQLSPFRLTPDQIVRATSAGVMRSRAAGRSLVVADLQAGARAENAAGLERLARRVEPKVTWSQLILPDDTLAQLRELADRARFRDVVIDEWDMGGGASRGRGVTGLFAGDPGTGKTMSAEVVAADLGLDLYVIDLSTVVDKYIGETEKNLDRIFDAADGINGVLLFDEADALFGKRSEVKDARDRYANVEIAYLLQRMERFDGLAVLTTNLRANLDEAFARRLDAVVDFAMPEEVDRQRLWEIHLPPSLPQADDIDLGFLAGRFRISGGNIRNICLAAAYFAAEGERAVTMADVVRGTEREYRKLGRMTVEEEFGRYFEVIRRPAKNEVRPVDVT